MAEDERVYNVPLRKEFLKVQRYRRANRAISSLKKFVSKHMKSDNIRISKEINEEIWKHGIKNPPHHIKVIVKKNDENIVTVKSVNPEKTHEKKKIKEGLIKKEEKSLEDEVKVPSEEKQ